jgi:regulator of protease activity HflC (stomatin/prohibitin superfamily)
MEKKMRAEREKRALIEMSLGEKESAINRAEGEKSAVIAASEAEKTKKINEAEGEKAAVIAQAEAQAEQILKLASATADGIRMIALALQEKGGSDALNMKLAQEYIAAFSKIAKEGNTLILPADAGNVGGMVSSILKIAEGIKQG